MQKRWITLIGAVTAIAAAVLIELGKGHRFYLVCLIVIGAALAAVGPSIAGIVEYPKAPRQ